MQKTAPMSWMTDDLALSSSPVRLHVGLETLGGSMKRCQRCDIPLGPRLCPNPQCGEQHGQSAGDLCAWCRQNHEERMDVIDFAHFYGSELEVLRRASTRLGRVAGPMGGFPGADHVREPCHGSRV
jgi:hypothetical protein